MVEIQANFIVNPNFLMAIVDKSEIIVICVVILIIIAIKDKNALKIIDSIIDSTNEKYILQM